jgi:hypothetical protein
MELGEFPEKRPESTILAARPSKRRKTEKGYEIRLGPSMKTLMKSTPACPLLLMPVLLLVGCLSSQPVSNFSGALSSQGQALGSFTVSSQTFSNQALVPSVCSSGDRLFFLGGDFTAENTDLVLRLVIDPLEGPAARLFSAQQPFDKSIVFRRSDCNVFHFSLDTTGWRVNEVYDYSITLELNCSRPGETISGRVSTTHCH